MNQQRHHPADAELFAHLRRMWQQADPMPDDLPDRVLFALDLEQLDMDFELLRLVSTHEADLSVRSAMTDVHTITFSGPSITVMLRVSEVGVGRRRIDAWLAPSSPLVVTVHHAGGSTDVDVDERGRFVVGDIPAGMTRLVLTPVHDPQAAPFITPTVEI